MSMSPVKLVSTALLVASVTAAHATLGGPESSVGNDGQAQAQPRALEQAASSGVKALAVTDPMGTQITEYVYQGSVFAVVWTGRVIPNLYNLFGSNFQTYLNAAQNRPPMGVNAPVSVRTKQLVAHTFGHMGDYRGSAYVTTMVPPGFDVSSIGVIK